MVGINSQGGDSKVSSRGILIVEDEQDWQKKLRKYLQVEGYQIEVVSSYSEALEKVQKREMDLIVVDLRLNEKDTDSATGMALLKDANDKEIPAIVVTAYGTREYIKQAYQDFSVESFFDKKTLQPAKLRKAVRNGLAKARYTYLRKLGFVCFRTGGDCAHILCEDPKFIFVAMPFRELQNNLYIQGIKPLEEIIDCTVKRADEEPSTAALMCNVCRLIQQARACLVDITGSNPNVLFELGLMCGWGKQPILIKHKSAKSKIPTDIAGALYIEYSYDRIDSLKEELAERLKKKGFRARTRSRSR